MSNYTYEIMSFIPADSWVKVRYEKDGSLPYMKLFTLVAFDEASIREQIEGFAPVVFAHWDRAEKAPRNLPVSGVQSATMTPIKPVVFEETEELTDSITQMLVEVLEEGDKEIVQKNVVAERPFKDQCALARNIRNFELSQTDFHALSDRVMSPEVREYRQALRDVPKQSGFPKSIKWPTL
jgi:hypothetical protein